MDHLHERAPALPLWVQPTAASHGVCILLPLRGLRIIRFRFVRVHDSAVLVALLIFIDGIDGHGIGVKEKSPTTSSPTSFVGVHQSADLHGTLLCVTHKKG